MVLRISSCSCCNERFVSQANQPLCSPCYGRLTQEDEPSTKRVRVDLVKISQPRQRQRQQARLDDSLVIDLCANEPLGTTTTTNKKPAAYPPVPPEETTNHQATSTSYPVTLALEETNDDDDDSEEAGSENGDEFHCTQIVDVDEDEHEVEVEVEVGKDEEEPQQQEEPVKLAPEQSVETRPSAPEQTTNPPPVVVTPPPPPNLIANNDVCLVCGKSLAGLKRRVDHIKRCSKKHGITGRDVKLNDDHETFAPVSSSPLATTTTTTTDASKNPYTRPSYWHSHESADLRLAEEQQQQQQQQQQITSMKQTSLTSFVQTPIRDVSKILMAGARRLSKVAEVVAARSVKPALSAANKKGRRSWPQQDYTKRSCPSYKKIPGTDFVCDGFQYAKSASTQNYFLTHFHADHYGGITSNWNAGIIYCSLSTATLVSQQLGVDKKYIHPLPMTTPTVIASSNGGKPVPVTVTLLDANHCPGAIMFLFEVGKRRILHVGDFRWNRQIMMQQAPLRAFASQQMILDELFLDTTYCNPKYTLPTQEETIKATIAFVEKDVQDCKDAAGSGSGSTTRTLHLCGAYTIGKERIYLSVAERFGWKVYVDKTRFRILSALNWPKERMALLTTRQEEACLWVVPLGHINMKKLPEYFPLANNKPFAKSYDRIVGYRPTGWSMGGSPSANIVTTRKSGNLTVVSVPYSEHSSFPELVDCLECLRPQKIVPTVSVSKSKEQVDTLLHALHNKQTRLSFKSKEDSP